MLGWLVNPCLFLLPTNEATNCLFLALIQFKAKYLFAFAGRGSTRKRIRGKKVTGFMEWLEKKVDGTGVFLALPNL